MSLIIIYQFLQFQESLVGVMDVAEKINQGSIQKSENTLNGSKTNFILRLISAIFAFHIKIHVSNYV